MTTQPDSNGSLQLFWAIGLALACTSSSLATTVNARDFTREQILEATKQVWTSLEHFDARTVESQPDQGESGVDYRHEMDFTRDGHYRIQSFRKHRGKEGETPSRTIGTPKEEIKVQYFRTPPYDIRNVTVGPQPGEPGNYIGPMNIFLWTFRPCGRPVHALLEDGAPLRHDEGTDLYEITTEYRGRPVTITLDPEHDWLPRSVVLGDLASFEVLAYRQVGGRWFPERAQSEMNAPRPDGSTVIERGEMTLDLVAVNAPIDPTLYERPPIPNGASLDDRIEGRRTLQGTREDAEALMKKYPETVSPPPGAVVYRKSEQNSRWIGWIPPIALAVGLLALFMMWRRRH